MDTTGRRLLVIAALAKLLGISTSGARKFDDSGRLPRAIRLGRCKRWDADEIEAWISAGAPSREKWETMKAAPAGKAGGR